MTTLGFAAPVARFVRAVVSAGVGAAVVAVGAQSAAISDFVVDAVKRVPGLDVNSETTVAFIAVAVVAAVIQAVDKFFRENGTYPDVVGK